MGISDNIKNIAGVVTVEVEGFFTERFINLCKINNIKIWNVRTIVKGVVRFKINIKEFKKLRKIARKTKCKVKIKEKEGLYFKWFKYRKRKFILLLVLMVILFSIAFSTFIWNIEITGNSTLTEEQILNALKESNIYIGKNKIGIDKKEVTNNLRINLSEISWAGIDISGTTFRLEVVEKTALAENQVQNNVPGDIVADKSGIITKIVPENGTAKFKIGSYVEEGTVVIEGVIYSKFIEPEIVTAKGIVAIDSVYEFQKDYKYLNVEKNYTGKTRHTVGITINSKEIMINYLNKNKKYDINKDSKCFNIFGCNVSFDLYHFEEYEEFENVKTKEKLLEEARAEAETYLNEEVLPNTIESNIKESKETVTDTDDGITYSISYTVNEQIGKFVERNSNE